MNNNFIEEYDTRSDRLRGIRVEASLAASQYGVMRTTLRLLTLKCSSAFMPCNPLYWWFC